MWQQDKNIQRQVELIKDVLKKKKKLCKWEKKLVHIQHFDSNKIM